MKEYIEAVIFPYIRTVKEGLQLPDEQGALLIFDNFKAQCTSTILTLLDSQRVQQIKGHFVESCLESSAG